MVMLLSDPGELNFNMHKQVLESLRDGVRRFLADAGDFSEVRLRDWLFVYEEGTPTVQLFLERVIFAEAPDTERSVNLSECMRIHRFLLENGGFDAFSDGVAIEVGSLGVEPPLRDLEDFRRVVGKTVWFQLWSDRSTAGQEMDVCEVAEKDGEPVVRFHHSEGGDAVVLLSTVRTARLVFSAPSKTKGRKGAKASERNADRKKRS